MERDNRAIKVLLIEDNPGDALLVEEYLSEVFSNLELTQASTFGESGEYLQKDHDFDTVLLDVSLPDSEGLDLVEEILRLAGITPLIILTGRNDLDFSMQSLSKGVSDYLLKDELSSLLLYKSIVYSIERNTFSRELKKSEKNYKDLFDLSPQPMYVFDLDTLEILDVNRAAVDKYGYSKNEFLTKTIRGIRPPGEMPLLEKRIQELGGGRDEVDAGIFQHQKKCGDIIYVHITTTTINYKGHIARIVVADDVTEKLRYEKKLEDSLREKEVLLAEIHHRVKNNLAVVSGLMQIQAFDEKNREVERKLLDSVFRIRTMASIHELLYESRSFSQVNFSQMVQKLAKDISSSMEGEKDIGVNIFDDALQLNINQAIPCALMVNEVLTNVYKHAFNDKQSGSIKIEILTDGDEISVAVQDDGIGLEDNHTKNSSSLGMQLISILTQQLNGEFQYFGNQEGTRFCVTFVKRDVKGPANSLKINSNVN